MRTPAIFGLPRGTRAADPARQVASPPPCRVARLLGLVCLTLAGWGGAHAQTFLENRPEQIPVNQRSQRGLPLSSTVTTTTSVTGSDGRAPTAAQQSADGLIQTGPTAGQFAGAVTYGGSLSLSSSNYVSTNSFGAAANMLDMPRGYATALAAKDAPVMVLRRAQIGAPYLGQQISYLFGSVIPVPATDETGAKITGQAPENYWLPEPYSTNDHATAEYYWSEHAQQVFAVQPGSIGITWQKAAPEATTPTTQLSSYVQIGGRYYRKFEVRYLVSGGAVKPPRKMYWTEGVYGSVGKKVTVPAARVNDVKVVYNTTMPERVAEPYVSPGEVALVTTNVFREQRTIWFDKTLGVISAYNREGRVFLELLGNARSGNARQHLGFEIVDVYREVTPGDVTVELGERLTAFADGSSDTHLTPDPIPSTSGLTFTFGHTRPGSDKIVYYANRETENLNDYLVHWLETGEAGLLWPAVFSRYKLVWPANPAKYSHYVRPLVATEDEAKATAVLLPSMNAPIIDYQDPLDEPRAKLTDDFRFYTFLEAGYPAHRALLRYSTSEQVVFERVFSWLDTNLRATNFAGTVATNLAGWSTNAALQTIVRSTNLVAPRVFEQTVEVGQRITAPAGESGSTTGIDYLAGYLRQSEGTSFNTSAYIDPFVAGFDEAQRGSIIPVNSINGAGRLEVWWFRPNTAIQAQGVKAAYWPSAIGRYNVVWPASASEIILASNDGSGGLGSLEAAGSIYYQNDPALPGYNPNEEHALMLGGQAYALRDDLNVTNGASFTSQPFVLLQYTGADGRPSMRPFKVLREKGNVRFDYAVTAGTVLQAPMPLPLLDTPFAPLLAGTARKSLNAEFGAVTITNAARSFNLVTLTLDQPAAFQVGSPLVLQNVSTTPVKTSWFMPWVYDPDTFRFYGYHSTNTPYLISSPPALVQPASATQWKFAFSRAEGLAVGTLMSVGTPGIRAWGANIVSTNVEAGFFVAVLNFVVGERDGATNAQYAVRQVATPDAPSLVGLRLSSVRRPENISDTNTAGFYSSFTYQDRKGNVWAYRGPNNEGDTDYLTMRYYYKTLPGFYFPAFNTTNQPAVGTVTPYLRSYGTSYVGDGTYGNANNAQVADGNALPIYYRPVWPANVPVLNMAETLTMPKRGLPSVRGQSSLQVLYQQSQAAGGGDLNRKSVLLHDSTREKTFTLGTGSISLTKVPDGIKQQTYNGRSYFPNLPPHLADRFYLDPTRGDTGALVFKGQFVDAPTGDDYLNLNVLGTRDSQYLRDLCPTGDPLKNAWDQVITNGLRTIAYRYIENTNQPGTYIPSTDKRESGPGDVVESWQSDVAVDSYALSAMGPGAGYVTLVAGNGRAFTAPDEPVSLQVIKVVNTLYRGELKPILSSNPLNERATLQQVVDLAGAASQYQFEWRIASPIDGLPPAVYANTRELLLGDGTWSHVRFPLATDAIADIASTPTNRYALDVTTGVPSVNSIPFTAVTWSSPNLTFVLPATPPHRLAAGNRVVAYDSEGVPLRGSVDSVTATNLVVLVDNDQPFVPDTDAVYTPLRLVDETTNGLPQAIVYRQFTVPATNLYSQLWLSLNLDDALGARVYLDGQLLAVANQAEGNTPVSSPSAILSPLPRAYRIGTEYLAGGTLLTNQTVQHTLAVELFSVAAPDAVQNFNARLEALRAVDQVTLAGTPWLVLDPVRHQDGIRAVLGDTADVRSLADNYLVMRYRATNTTHASYATGWSAWTEPQLVEGWIKRVLAGLNPFNQRVKDLFNNRVNTDASILTQAGARWEGDVALNLSTINNYGLIEIYETVLRRGKGLSIDAGINFGPANDALLLAAGYLNDLYVMMGNEAVDDAANPTIGIGTKDTTYGEVSTALFAFKGQTASLLEEELALLRGRDDFLQPGVQTAPVYNRLVWNYTRGIDSGEVIYALNYNIKENNDTGVDGVIDADDARKMFPQGHGDAYGHYLTALKGYYSLLLDTDFDWVPRTEAVTVLGQPVQVDYQDERKFAAAAAATAKAGKQVFDLTWRKDYVPGDDAGWEHFAATRDNLRRTLPTTRFWGVDHWASRTVMGAYVNWVAGNAIVPARDIDPSHEGIQIIERDTVPELAELVSVADDLQTALDGAEAHLSPLGLPEGGLAFDINPSVITGENPKPHFEQIYDRAKGALNNALAAFDDAKDVTRQMRAGQDSLSELQAEIGKQELAYEYSLIELYGSPYPEDIGPGLLYATDYAGPDYLHFMYVDNVQMTFPGILQPKSTNVFRIDLQTLSTNYNTRGSNRGPRAFLSSLAQAYFSYDRTRYIGVKTDYREGKEFLTYRLEPHEFFKKPADWKGRRGSPGKVQDAIGRIMLAHNSLYSALNDNQSKKYQLDRGLDQLIYKSDLDGIVHQWDEEMAALKTTAETVMFAAKMAKLAYDTWFGGLDAAAKAASEAIPHSTIVGLANGGDLLAPARATILASFGMARAANDGLNFAKEFISGTIKLTTDSYIRDRQANLIGPRQRQLENLAIAQELELTLSDLQSSTFTVNQRLQELDNAYRNYYALLAQGDRILQEREIFRQRSAAVVQGYRTRDAAFRIFRNEKLERYKTLFDLAARYSFIAANAYDYETGLLHTDAGRAFVNRIVNARALGVVRNGEPQYAGSNTGDPGLSSALAEMKADWDVLKGRLGFNNPDAYGTTVSLRTENFRTLPGVEGNQVWKDILLGARKDNLLEDEDVRRYCMQIDRGDGLPVPGLIIDFSTSIGDTVNLFGRPRAAGDHWYSPSSFATKIFGAGVALEGYIGMNDPVANSGAVGTAGATSPGDPSVSFLTANGLGATPYVYLIPVGVDSMRSPPLGDESEIRSWNVADVTVPLPFNIGASGFSSKKLWQSSDSLTEQLFSVRKHQAFRPVSTTAAFSTSLYGNTGQLQRSQFTNNRLIGRSVWNSKWKLVIPGRELLSDPKEGLDRFVQTVRDIKLHFVTYSYSGN